MSHIDGTVGYICTIPMVYEPFVTSLVGLVLHNEGKGIHAAYKRTTVGSQAVARNDLVKNIEGHWLFFIDTDIILPSDALEKMLRVMKKDNLDVLSGLYQEKQFPYYPVAYQKDGDALVSYNPKFNNSNIDQVYAAGGGCLLVKKKVFDRIRDELKEEPFDIKDSPGEDVCFFMRLEKLGIKSYVTNEVRLGHLALQPIVQEHYLASINQYGNSTRDNKQSIEVKA